MYSEFTEIVDIWFPESLNYYENILKKLISEKYNIDYEEIDLEKYMDPVGIVNAIDNKRAFIELYDAVMQTFAEARRKADEEDYCLINEYIDSLNNAVKYALAEEMCDNYDYGLLCIEIDTIYKESFLIVREYTMTEEERLTIEKKGSSFYSRIKDFL